MQLAFYQPDIPQNLGSAIRLAACLDVALHVIEPCGFPFDYKRMKSACLDYWDQCRLTRHASWQAFCDWKGTVEGARLLLFSTKASVNYTEFRFREQDILLMGRESAGVPPEVHAAADARLRIPLNPQARSLNVVMTAAMALGEGLRQTGKPG